MINLLVKEKKSYDFKLPLVEKYRPTTFNDIIFNSFLSEKFETMVENNYIPNMIFTGEPSTGKTSTALFLATKLFNNSNILELNASDDRGITVITSVILPFCKKKSDNPKVIILDEADSITTKAQQILANIMDEYNEKVKIIYICNEYHKINEEIQTRCVIINFPKMNKKQLVNKIVDICNKEKIDYEGKAIERMIFYSNYDIRQCLNYLECIQYNENIININSVNNIIDKPKLENIKNILKYCIKKKKNKVLNEIHELIKLGYNANDILLIFMKYLQEEPEDIETEYLLGIYKIISKYYININNGILTKCQLYGFINEIFEI